MTRRTRSRSRALHLQGSLRITAAGAELGGPGRIALLKAVAEQGSITQAAKAFGMSYKGAWDAIDAMNQAAGQALVETRTGGRGGGHAQLTEYGQRLASRYEQVNAVHQRFIEMLDRQTMNLDQEFSILAALNMKTSARNQWLGTVSVIRPGAVNVEVEVTLTGGTRIAAIVTRDSTDALELRVKQTVFVLVKAQAVWLATGLNKARVSTRNRFEGVVQALRPGAVNAEVIVETSQGLGIAAILAQSEVTELGLAVGSPVTALVKASDIILACESGL